jgi:hypothetical protein
MTLPLDAAEGADGRLERTGGDPPAHRVDVDAK